MKCYLIVLLGDKILGKIYRLRVMRVLKLLLRFLRQILEIHYVFLAKKRIIFILIIEKVLVLGVEMV